ncbi:hypothetical protein ACE1SV_16140 [Streptomyces sennicomposti]
MGRVGRGAGSGVCAVLRWIDWIDWIGRRCEGASGVTCGALGEDADEVCRVAGRGDSPGDGRGAGRSDAVGTAGAVVRWTGGPGRPDPSGPVAGAVGRGCGVAGAVGPGCGAAGATAGGCGVAGAVGRADTGAPSPRRGAGRSALRWTTGGAVGAGALAGAAGPGASAAGPAVGRRVSVVGAAGGLDFPEAAAASGRATGAAVAGPVTGRCAAVGPACARCTGRSAPGVGAAFGECTACTGLTGATGGVAGGAAGTGAVPDCARCTGTSAAELFAVRRVGSTVRAGFTGVAGVGAAGAVPEGVGVGWAGVPGSGVGWAGAPGSGAGPDGAVRPLSADARRCTTGRGPPAPAPPATGGRPALDAPERRGAEPAELSVAPPLGRSGALEAGPVPGRRTAPGAPSLVMRAEAGGVPGGGSGDSAEATERETGGAPSGPIEATEPAEPDESAGPAERPDLWTDGTGAAFSPPACADGAFGPPGDSSVRCTAGTARLSLPATDAGEPPSVSAELRALAVPGAAAAGDAAIRRDTGSTRPCVRVSDAGGAAAAGPVRTGLTRSPEEGGAGRTGRAADP